MHCHHSISVIEDDELKLLIQECMRLGTYFVSFILSSYLRLGSLYGNINLDNILHGRTTISNHFYQLADGCHQQIKPLLLEPYESRCLSISPDFCSDKHRQISYLGVSCYASRFQIIQLISLFENSDKSSGNVLIVYLRRNFKEWVVIFSFFQTLESELLRFEIDDISKITIVCDRDANFLKAFRSYDPILCYAHRLNNILKRTFFQNNEYSTMKLLLFAYSTSSSSEVDDDDDGIHFNDVSKPIQIFKKEVGCIY